MQPHSQPAPELPAPTAAVWGWSSGRGTLLPKGTRRSSYLIEEVAKKIKNGPGPMAPGGTTAARPAHVMQYLSICYGAISPLRRAQHSRDPPGGPSPQAPQWGAASGAETKVCRERIRDAQSCIDPKAADTEVVLNVPSTALAAAKPPALRGSHPQPQCWAPLALLKISCRRPNVVIPSAWPSPASLLQGKGTRRHLMRRGVRSNCAE